MKLIKQVRLEFREGTSDKVYEVDLCEVGADQFVVNFRYGRRGTTLRDGTKTAAPVNQTKADSVFNSLVASKRREGYVDHGTSQAPQVAPARPASTPMTTTPEAAAAREQAILNRLRDGYSSNTRKASGKKPWPITRAIWRAGELGYQSAEPLLLDLLHQALDKKTERSRKPPKDQFNRQEAEQLLGKQTLRLPHHRWGRADWALTFSPPEDFVLYVLAWSLSRCGSTSSVPALKGLAQQSWEPIGRIATAGLLRLLVGVEREQLMAGLADLLPARLGPLARTGPSEYFHQALQEHLAAEATNPSEVLDTLYLIDNEHVRPGLLHVLRTAPLQSAYFQCVRHIFKVAELRRDGEVFGLLTHRFETTEKVQTSYLPQVNVKRFTDNKVERTQSHFPPFRENTRRYFRLRTWRTLRRLGDIGHAEYVRLASGVLLAFTDADARQLETWTEWDYKPTNWGRRRSNAKQRHRGPFGRYWAFNQILYHNSDRFEIVSRRGLFNFKPNWRPGTAEPVEREEAFPELWQAAPEAVLNLLGDSRCEPVHRFGVKVLRACPDYCRNLDVPALVRLLEANYEVTVELGLELALQRYDPTNPDLALVLALAHSGLARARQQARQWIDEQREPFTRDLAFLADLAASPQGETRTYARELLRQTTFSQPDAEALIARLISSLRSFTAEEGVRARDVTQTLQVVFATPMRRVGVDVIRDLIDHPLAEIRRFAGELLLAHVTFATHPPEDLLLKLLRDGEASVRGVGVRLLGQLPDELLKHDIDVLVGLTRHELVDFRENVRPVVKRLAASDPDFGRRFAERLIEALLVPGAPEGVPSHTSRVLRDDLRPYLDRVPPATVWKLLQSRSSPAQEVGGVLLASNVRPQDLHLAEIVILASHDILSVREASWHMSRVSLDRFKADMTYATQLVDAKWEDSRRFAFDLLRDAFGRGELTPGVLVSLCDSVRPDVQQFGREMITRLFAEPDGPEYAIKMSEHPSQPMQMFAATFLERFAGTDPMRLRELTFYFQNVLSRVNQGRVAKERVLTFLDKAARAGEESAAVVAEILGRQSATAAVGGRARAIEILTRIQSTYPGVKMPLTVRPVEVRSGV